ncbi:MAG: radical SAM/SPASM domain-containing protein [Armatimonadota bacterium]
MSQVQQSAENLQPLFTNVVENTIRHFIPFNAIVELTYRCNLRCRHCYIPEERRSRSDLTTDELLSVVDQLAELGCLYLTLTGGEILIRRDFFDIAWHAKRRGFALKLFTNGTLIDAAMADRIAELRPFTVDISLYGSQPSTHDQVTGAVGSYQKAMDALQMLVDRGVRTSAKLPLMDGNFAEYKSLLGMCRRMGVGIKIDPSIAPMDDGCTAPLALRISDDQLYQVFSDPEVCPKGHLPAPPSQLCEAGRNTLTVGPTGDVVPCLQLPLIAGNVRQTPLREIWMDSPVFRRLRGLTQNDLKQCSQCELAVWCNRCPGLAYLEDGDYLGCSSRARQVARVRRKVAEARKHSGPTEE